MGNLHVLAPDFSHKLHVVISRHTQRTAEVHAIHHEADDLWNLWPAIHEVANKNHLPTFWMMPRTSALSSFVAELGQQLHQFIKTSVNIANDVERSMLLLQIIPQRLPLNHGGFDFFQRFQHMHMAETLALQPAQ